MKFKFFVQNIWFLNAELKQNLKGEEANLNNIKETLLFLSFCVSIMKKTNKKHYLIDV